MGLPINTKENEFYPSVTETNNLYFTSEGLGSKGKDDIFDSKYKEGKHELPKSLSDSINSDGIGFNSLIEPDESFLIFTCYKRAGGLAAEICI